MDPRLANVPGFGQCRRCPYLETAPAELCYACARHAVEALADPAHRCAVCDRPFEDGESWCRNPLCTAADRGFEWNMRLPRNCRT